jgi:N-acetylmuramoyl-L-alanine amidase
MQRSVPAQPAQMRLRGRGCLGFLLIAALASSSAPAIAGSQLMTVRYGEWADRARVVLDLSSEASFTHRYAAEPDRIIVELPSSGVAPGVADKRFSDELVLAVRVTRLRGPAAQVVIEISRPCRYEAFALPADGDHPPRIVLDLFRAGRAPARGGEAREEGAPDDPAGETPGESDGPESAGSDSLAIPEPEGAADRAEDDQDGAGQAGGVSQEKDAIEEFVPDAALRVQAPGPAGRDAAATGSGGSAAQPQPAPKRRVAIDAGHGGADSGARRGSIDEKRVCLDFARKLAAAINEMKGYEAFLTRDDDRFIPLRRRYLMAEEARADIFVSIHANAAHSRAANGTEVFFLSLDGASDEASRELARKENASDEIGGVSPEAEQDLATILRDLRRSDALLRSSFLAEAILDELLNIPGVESRGVKQAGFTVLKSAQMPSVLVETGFLSNAKERNRLTDPKYQEIFVDRIRDGVVGFFERYGLARR